MIDKLKIQGLVFSKRRQKFLEEERKIIDYFMTTYGMEKEKDVVKFSSKWEKWAVTKIKIILCET